MTANPWNIRRSPKEFVSRSIPRKSTNIKLFIAINGAVKNSLRILYCNMSFQKSENLLTYEKPIS